MDMTQTRTFLYLAACIVLLFFSTATAVTAKEDTARLVFEKKARSVQSEKTYAYTVKRGENLLAIVRKELGLARHHYSEVLRQNPHIKNPDLIHPGQKIYLPISLRRADLTGIKGPLNEQTTEKRGLIQGDRFMPAQAHLTLMGEILMRMNGSLTTSGQHTIPLSQAGQLTVDCNAIPVAEFDDGTVVLLDFKGQLPDNVQRLIARHWTNYRVLSLDSRLDPLTTLSQVVAATRGYEMRRLKSSYRYGIVPAVSFPAEWILLRRPALAGRGPSSQVITRVSEGGQRLPRMLVSYLEKNGVMVSEVLNGSVADTPITEEGPNRSSTLPRLPVSPPQTLVVDLLTRLGLEPRTDREVEVFNARDNGFNLSVRADDDVSKGDREALFVTHPLPTQFVEILGQKSAIVVVLYEADPPKRVLENTLSALHIPYSAIPYEFPLSLETATDKAIAVFPALGIPQEKDGPLYLIDFDMDEDLYRLLHDQMGFALIQY